MSDAAIWTAQFDAMLTEWHALAPVTVTPDLGKWQAEFRRITEHQRQLVAAGLWQSGPSDLMHVIRVAEDELVHSRVVAWLLDPSARHGFGTFILERILRAGWPGPLPLLEAAVVTLERPVDRTRADIIVEMGASRLVVENKVLSREHTEQCQALFDEWMSRDDGGDTRFLLLTLDGYLPLTTRTPEAAAAWRALGYGELMALMREALDRPSRGAVGSLGRATVVQYVRSLSSLAREHPFKVRSPTKGPT